MKKTIITVLALCGMAMGADTFTIDNVKGAFVLDGEGSITSVIGKVSLNDHALTLAGGDKWGADVTTDRQRTAITYALTFDMAKLSGVATATKILTLGDWGVGVRAGDAADTVKFTGTWGNNADYFHTGDIAQIEDERSIIITLSSVGTRIYDNGTTSFYSNKGLKGDTNRTSLTISDLGLSALTKVVVWSDSAYADAAGDAAKAATAFTVLNAVPEPATATLSLLALGALAARRRRR